jgi:hypothetical protein
MAGQNRGRKAKLSDSTGKRDPTPGVRKRFLAWIAEQWPLPPVRREKPESTQRAQNRQDSQGLGEWLGPLWPMVAEADTAGVNQMAFASLEEVLNWTDNEVDSHLVWFQLAPPVPLIEDTAELARAVRLLRRLGTDVVKARTPVGSAGEVLSPEDRERLVWLANMPITKFALCSYSGGIVWADMLHYPRLTRLVLAARAFWPVFEGTAQLARCPAPAPDIGGSKLCNRYFARLPHVDKIYCCPACKQRAYDRRKKSRAA